MFLTTKRPINRLAENVQMSMDDYLAHIYDGVPLPDTERNTTTNTVYHSDKFYRTITRQIDGNTMLPATERNFLFSLNEQINRAIIRFLISNRIIICTQPERLPYDGLPQINLSEHYEYFKIPKRSGGLREICAPKEDLKNLMREVKVSLEKMGLLAHDCAYAYVKGRSCKDALMEHQYNDSKWFLKLDLKNFFTNCNRTFIYKQLRKLFIFKHTSDYQLGTLIEFCLLNNGLPQGTPLSPLITNLIMVPIDHAINKALHDKGNFVYTRYADDLLISSKYQFNKQEIIQIINGIFREQEAPFMINREKTRFGSAAGSNWNLGLMLNKDNNITIGHKNVQRLKATINNFLRDFTNGTNWSIIDVQEMLGTISYAKNITPDYVTFIIQRLEQKYNQDFTSAYKTILNGTA